MLLQKTFSPRASPENIPVPLQAFLPRTEQGFDSFSILFSEFIPLVHELLVMSVLSYGMA